MTDQLIPSDQMGRLVGSLTLTGDTTGTTHYAWLKGGFFMVQTLDMRLARYSVRVTEIIGHLKSFGGEPSLAIHSRAYNAQGNTFDYVV